MELGGNVIGSIAGSLHLEGEGDTIEVSPIVTSGTKIATITVNEGKPDETNYNLYAPEDFSGSYNDLTGKPYLNGQIISGNMYTHIYSLEERVVGTWIDGKPLYQKTYDITLTENVTYLDTSALNIKRLIEIIGQCDSNNGANALFVPYYEDSTWRMYPQMDYANQRLSIVTTTTVRTYYSKLSFTIKYTKTTD